MSEEIGAGPGSTSPEPGPPAEEVPCRCTDALADAACRTHGVIAFLSGLGIEPGPGSGGAA